MQRSLLGRIVPATLTTVGVAIPSATAAGVMLHAMLSGSAAAGASSGASSAVPSGSGVAAAVTPTSTAAATATPSPAAATPKPAATATPQAATVTTRTITGPVEYDRFGAVQATVTLTGKKITNVSISAPQDNPRSAGINAQAVPLLVSETLQAQSANVNAISGATLTSDAYIQSLQGALQAAGLG